MMSRPAMKTPPTIQSLWIGAPFSNLEKLCAQSFLDHGHEFHLYTYADIDGVPEGVVIKDGNEIMPYSELTAGALQFPESLADCFRYALLYKRGGWWVDMDTVCIRPFDFPDDVIFSSPTSGERIFQNCSLRFPVGHPLMKAMWELTQQNLRSKRIKRAEAGGPIVLTEQIHKFGLQHLAQPGSRFSLPHANGADYFNDSYRDGLHFPANMHALHVYNSVLVKMGIDKNARFDDESLFEQLKTRHGIPQVADARRVTSDEVNSLQKARAEKQRKSTRNRKKREVRLWIAVIILASALIASHL